LDCPLFQLLRLNEDTLEQLLHDDAEPYGQSVGRIYLAKVLQQEDRNVRVTFRLSVRKKNLPNSIL
jgi:hypothetical protein